jgi:hypothetical protein
MSLECRQTLGLLASGAVLLLLGSWMLQGNVPPRGAMPRTVRKSLGFGRGHRVPPPRELQRGDGISYCAPLPVALDADGRHLRATAG